MAKSSGLNTRRALARATSAALTAAALVATGASSASSPPTNREQRFPVAAPRREAARTAKYGTLRHARSTPPINPVAFGMDGAGDLVSLTPDFEGGLTLRCGRRLSG